MVTQIRIPEEEKEKMEEVVENLKWFFEEKNIKFEVDGPEVDEDGTVYVYFNFNGRVEFTEEQFDDFIVLLEDGLGFYNANGAENQIANYIGYKEWLVYDEYRHHSKDVVVYLKYYEVQANETRIYLDHVTVATNTVHYEEEVR
ncbi:MAG: hypothetical protein JHC26_05835 [Thermofilum sp.]|jgi:hypothetical protein|uniref:hypothetical protein n=1 Tax=Thermofilum sp. TaxID=1961369 RepID=UPI0025883BA9|nr:hypothetical protein [Thermofilum sp.]MCI4408592.1 hypothetical protein [Thermofilum sp.]